MEELEKKIIELREGSIPVAQFEVWIYENEWLKEVIGTEGYENLLLLNYKTPHSLEEIKKFLTPFIDEGKLEKKRIQAALESIISRDKKAAKSLITIYNCYSEGYFFLKELALGISIRLINPGPDYGTNNFSDLSSEEKEDLMNGLYPQAKQVAIKIATWLERDELIMTGEQEKELGRWQYIDQRSSMKD